MTVAHRINVEAERVVLHYVQYVIARISRLDYADHDTNNVCQVRDFRYMCIDDVPEHDAG
jgi:hypothetical protein